jgi:hypothetical protein
MAQHVVHQVVQVLAPGCMPLFLTDGFKEYTTALLTHDGQWVQPARQRAQGPAPTPRWMPLPGLLYAQGIKTVRRRRLVRVRHRVIFGTLVAIEQVLAAHGWHINTAFVERLNLTIRQQWRRWDVVSPRSARARMACGSSWPYIRSTIISVCPIPACASLSRSLNPPRASARPRRGGPVRQRWRRD